MIEHLIKNPWAGRTKRLHVLQVGHPCINGIKLDRALTFRRHLQTLRQKLTSHVGLLRRLAGSSWDANATILRTATLALVHSMAEYCALVWCRSAHTHLIDKSINDAWRLVTECLRPTATDNLFILAGIQPTELRRQNAVLSLARDTQERKHLLYGRLLSLLCGQLRQLKSKHLYVPAALELQTKKTSRGLSCPILLQFFRHNYCFQLYTEQFFK